MTPANGIWLAAYIAFAAAIAGGMFYARSAVMAEYDTPEAKAEWEKWREKAQLDSKKWRKEHGLPDDPKATIDRRPPPSEEPPALVMMRDYFGTCLFAALFFGSLLFAMLCFAIRGAFSGDEAVAEGATSQPDSKSQI